MEVTQAELDAMLASGEVSLTPSTEVTETTPSQEVETKEKPTYELPKLRPPLTMNKSQRGKYDTKKNAYLDYARKLKDPELAKKAFAAIDQPARLSDISRTLTVLTQEDNRRAEIKKQEALKAKLDISMTRDRKKARQKYAVQVGDFHTSLDNIDYLVDNFNDDYVGYGDTMMHNMGRVLDMSDPKQSQYKKRYGTLLPNFKELENMGASFTGSEQEMLKNIMPQIDSGDSLFRADLVNFITILKNKVAGKLNALEDGDYRTGDLRKIVGRYEKTLARAKEKFGEDFTENNELGAGKEVKSDSHTVGTPRGFKADIAEQNNEGDAVDNTSPKKHDISKLTLEEKKQLLRGR